MGTSTHSKHGKLFKEQPHADFWTLPRVGRKIEALTNLVRIREDLANMAKINSWFARFGTWLSHPNWCFSVC